MREYLKKQIVYSLVARVIVFLLMAINIKLYSNNLTSIELGEYFLILTYAYLINSFVFVPFDYYFQKKYLKKFKQGNIHDGFNLIISLLFVYFIASNGVAFILQKLKVYDYLDSLIISLLAIPIFLITTLRNTLNNLYYQSIVNFSFIIEGILKVGIFITFLHISVLDSKNSLVLSLLIAGIFTSIFLVLKFPHIKTINKVPVDFQIKKVWNAFIKFSPLSFAAVLLLIQTQGYRIVYDYFGKSDLIGLFSTTSNIGTVIIGATFIIVNQYVHPQIYKSNGKSVSQFAMYALPILLVLSLILLFFAPFISRILLSPEFNDISYLMVYGMLIDGLVQINGTIAIRNSLYERNSSTMKIYMLGTGLMGTIFYWLRDSFLDISHIGKILVIVQLFIFSSFIVYIQISENGQRKRAK